MEEKESKQLEHSWYYNPEVEFFCCERCGVRVTKILYTLEKDDRTDELSTGELLDQIVDVECE